MNSIYDFWLTARGIGEYYKYFYRSDFATTEEIRRKQSEWLRELLHHSKANIPWYSNHFRTYGVRVDGADPFAELAKLPILSKAEVRSNHADFCALGNGARSLKFATSGTTGEPMVAYTSPQQWIIEQAMIWRHWQRAGYRFRDRMAIFRSYAPKPLEPTIRIDRLRNWAYFSVFKMDDASIAEYANFLQKWRPSFIRGYPSSLLLVAQHAIRHGWRLPGLRAAFSASEVVPTQLRETLKAAFGVELFDHYGQAEITCMFHDCERHEGMHIDWEYGVVELIPTSEPGVNRIIATNLHNKAMPLLRYDTGDLAASNWEKCSCGRTTPVVRTIRGRRDDFLIAKDGSRMTTVNLYTYFSKISYFQKYQVLQTIPGEIVVKFVLWEDAAKVNVTALSEKIRSELEQSTSLSVSVVQGDDFLQSREGKFPAFVQKVGR